MVASESCTATPSLANNLAVWLLPMPIEPVRPMTKGLGMVQGPDQKLAQSLGHFGFDAEKCLEGGNRLVHQHAEPIETNMSPRPGSLQQIGFQRVVNDVAHG